MDTITSNIELLIAVGTFTLQIVTGVGILVWAFYVSLSQKDRKNIWMFKYFPLVDRYVLEIGLLMSLGAMVGSLFYSDVLKLPPCELCWLQRVFMYPQVVLYGVALGNKRDKSVVDYSLVMSGIGLVLSLYQVVLQKFPGLVPQTCGGGIDCSRVQLNYFGYMTIPVMSLTMFCALFLLALVSKYEQEIRS